jgi:hypothetical protein
VVFSQWVDQSEHEAAKNSSVVLRMSEISLNILRAKYLNVEALAVLAYGTREPKGARRYLNAVLDSRTHEM